MQSSMSQQYVHREATEKMLNLQYNALIKKSFDEADGSEITITTENYIASSTFLDLEIHF